MISLYQWLLEHGYSEAEAEEAVLRFDAGMPIPDNIKKDIRLYSEEFIQKFKGL